MIYRNIKYKNNIKHSINKHKNTKVKIAKTKCSLTFLIRCRNNGIIPNFIRNALKNIHNIFKTPQIYHIKNTLKGYIDTFQNKILNLLIKQKHYEIKNNQRDQQNIEKTLGENLTQQEINIVTQNESKIISNMENEIKNTQKRKFEKLKQQQMIQLGIKQNDKWFVNKTNTQFPDDVKWLLSLGEKFGLPTTKSQFPLFKLIADGEDVIQTWNDKEQQEMMRTKFTTMIDTHMNKMKESERDKFINSTVGRTKTFLKQNKNILILNADKGNVTVAMDINDYKQRMNSIISDMMTYQRVNKDPTTGLIKKNNELVEELYKNNIITTMERKKLRSDVATAPRLYGLPKIHKVDFPLRPICSSINSPSEELCKYVVKILKNLTKFSKYNVQDSMAFKNKVKNMTIKENDRMVSFDVVSLFPSIPIDLGIQIIDERWEELKEYTNMTKGLFLSILKFCIKDNRYFKYDDKIYKQKKGLPMGSPASPVVADIVMEKLLDTCMEKLTTKPKILTKYVDDLFVITGEDAINDTLNILNSFSNNIKFTMEDEMNGCLPYLDTIIYRKKDKLELDWYQKPTASGRIINFFSKHPKQMIINTAKNLVHRVMSISDEKFHNKNKHKIRDILTNNNFPIRIINRLIGRRNTTRETQKDEKIYKSMIYVPNLSERFQNSNLYDKNKYIIAQKNNNTLKKLFSHTKDKIQNPDKHNVIYQIQCDGNPNEKCGKYYVGTTKNKLKTRLSAHKSDLKMRNQNYTQKTALAEHCISSNHQPNLEQVKILQTENHYHRRLTLEMLHINNLHTTERINFKSDTDNAAYCYRHLTQKKRSCNM
ncbi:uncharacterized protein LOC131801989 [Musca domestica]|uniref:Uncharacterized protein LOC131801989 n=2 Tax=Musca domestica TaxID=7370 RepID=A0ABM3UUN6_MUSDO|nr:uncharacterized protein LOC131801989 [Musca domestica]XP_058977228.1 uncharacterized protein LOC131801989 [Musca domestica]